MINQGKVGFVSFRFAGTDGVTLETLKWVEIFTRNNWLCYFLCGESDMPAKHSYIVPELHFTHPEIEEISKECFNAQVRSQKLTDKIHDMRRLIKSHIHAFIKKYDINLLVLQNVLAIPMNVPFSMALVEVIAETQIKTIAHHHDFFWERERFSVNCIQDILSGCFPPNLSSVVHVVINSLAQQQLGYRTGLSSVVVPNVMEFERPAQGKDEYNSTFRSDIGLDDDQHFILQPTRIVQRKGIEHAIELTRRLNKKSVLVISHEAGDEGGEYKQRLIEYAKLLHVELYMVADKISDQRGIDAQGNKVYTLGDCYAHADIVTYPSLIEGFGNAFLEAVYFQRPIIVNLYPVYVSDIKPKGFSCIEFNSFVSSDTVAQVRKLLKDPRKKEEMAQKNLELAVRHYSFGLLNTRIKEILEFFYGK